MKMSATEIQEMRSRPLQGISVSATGVSSSEERTIRGCLDILGGIYHVNLVNETKFLIVKRVGSQKYVAAKKLGIPVLVMQWLIDCNVSKAYLPIKDYEAGPFYGLTICCTQISPEERYKLERTVIENGGKFEKHLDLDHITHLVAGSAEGDKYAAAKLWGLTVVNPSWVADCVSQKRWIVEQPYMTIEGSSGKDVKAGAGGIRDKEIVKAEKAKVLAFAVEKYNRYKEESEQTRGVRKKSAKDDIPASASSTAHGLSSRPESAQSEDPTVAWEDLPHPREIPRHRRQCLEQERIFFTGFTKEQTDYLMILCACGAGTHHHNLQRSTTLILLGPQAPDSLVLEACEHPCGAPCVQIQWLIERLVPGYLDRIQQARAEETAELVAAAVAEAHYKAAKSVTGLGIDENAQNTRSECTVGECSAQAFARSVLGDKPRIVRTQSLGINRSLSERSISTNTTATSHLEKNANTHAALGHPLVVDWRVEASEPESAVMVAPAPGPKHKKRGRGGRDLSREGEESQWVVWD